MFEMEDYSSGYHEGYFSKFADNAESMLDCYVSDSLQDMLDIDIRSEIANVVGGGTDISAMVGEFPLDDAANAISSNKNNTNNNSSISGGNSLSSLGSSSWMGPSSWVSSYSSSNDFYVDLGACVNPISVMPLISSSLMHASPIATNLNAAATTAQSPVSPMNDINKSHLTFSPAQMKVSAGSIRHEQLVSHIPKQIVTIPTAMGGGGQTMAPATMATNAALQRKLGQMSSQVDVVKKDLNKINKVNANAPVTALVSLKTLKAMKNQNINNNNNKSTINLNESTIAINGLDNTNTIKLAPGIGGLTFANSITYNKLKQQSAVKSPQGSPVTANGNIVLKRDRDASPLHNMTTLNGNKMLARNANGTYTPKGIASAANSPHHHLQHMRASSPAQSISMSPTSSHSSSSSSSASFSPSTSTTTTTNNNNHHNHNSNNNSHQQQQQQYPTYINGIHNNNNNNNINNYQNINFKSLQQKAKVVATSVNNHMSIGGNNGGSGASGEILENDFPKPAYSYSCLIAMALKNSRSGSLPVSEIYSFMCEHFPYFKSAPSGWKNSVRHNLSLNKCFEKIEKPATNGNQRKGCLWAMNPERIAKMDEEVQKWSRKDPMAIRNAMIYPEHLEALERGDMKHGSADSDIELDSQSEVEEVSDLEEQEIEDVFIDNCLVEDVEVDDDESFGTLVAHTESDIANNNNNNNQNNNHQNNKNNTNNTMVEVVETKLRRINNNFDIEVEDIYDAMDMEDDKSNITMQVNPCDSIIEIVTSDLDVSQTTLKTKQKPMQSQQQQQNHGSVVVSVAEFQNAKRPRLSYTISNQSQSLSQQQPQQPPKQQQSAQIALQRQQQINKQQLIQLQQQLKQQQNNNINNNNNNGVTNNSTIPVNTTSSMPMKKVKVIQQQQPPLQQKNQHNIIVHTLSNNSTNTSSLASSVSSASSPTTTTLMNGGNVVTTVLSNSQYAQLANLQQQQQQQQQQQRRKVQLVSRMA